MYYSSIGGQRGLGLLAIYAGAFLELLSIWASVTSHCRLTYTSRIFMRNNYAVQTNNGRVRKVS